MIPSNDTVRFYLKHKDDFDSAISSVLLSGIYILGPQVKKFESDFAKMLGCDFCIGVDNGTNAIKLGIQALDIGKGDEVIVQANTYIATVLGITVNGATPIFVEPNEFYNMDDSSLEDKITNRTKAIIVTHLYGQATKMDKIINICKKYNLFLLEDCAQSHFAKFKDKYVGTFGDLGFFSFYPTKNIGCFGDGGAITTSNPLLEKKIRMLRNYGSQTRYDFELANGSNSRLDEIQASLLNVKLRYFREIIEEKEKIANRYISGIINKNIKLPKISDGSTHVWHLFVIEVENRNDFIDYMRNHGIVVDVHYPIPPHLSKCYAYLGHHEKEFEKTEYFSKHIVDLPIFNGMTNDEIDFVIEAINKYDQK